MKKMATILLAMAIFFSVPLGAAAFVPVPGGTKPATITAVQRRDAVILAGDKSKTFKDERDNILRPIEYADTIYLPIDAINQSGGKDISWKVSANTTNKPKNIEIAVLWEYKLNVDGKLRTTKDSNKNILHPIKYNGKVYLAEEAVAKLTGYTVTESESKKRIMAVTAK